MTTQPHCTMCDPTKRIQSTISMSHVPSDVFILQEVCQQWWRPSAQAQLPIPGTCHAQPAMHNRVMRASGKLSACCQQAHALAQQDVCMYVSHIHAAPRSSVPLLSRLDGMRQVSRWTDRGCDQTFVSPLPLLFLLFGAAEPSCAAVVRVLFADSYRPGCSQGF